MRNLAPLSLFTPLINPPVYCQSTISAAIPSPAQRPSLLVLTSLAGLPFHKDILLTLAPMPHLAPPLRGHPFLPVQEL